MGIGPLLAWRRASVSSIWRNFRWPALFAALVAIDRCRSWACTDFWANVGFSVCAFTAATILYEVWRGMRVRHAHGETYVRAVAMLVNRHRQRYGGYLVHLGLIVLAVGVIGSHFFQHAAGAQLQARREPTFAGYTLHASTARSARVEPARTPSRRSSRCCAAARRCARSSRVSAPSPASPISPSASSRSPPSGSTMSTSSSPRYDGADATSVRVFVNPLTPLVWMGGALMLLGGILCWWPERRRRPTLIEQPARREREAVTL